MPEFNFGSLKYLPLSEKKQKITTKKELIEALLSLKKKPIEVYMTIYYLKHGRVWRGKRGIKGLIKSLNIHPREFHDIEI